MRLVAREPHGIFSRRKKYVADGKRPKTSRISQDHNQIDIARDGKQALYFYVFGYVESHMCHSMSVMWERKSYSCWYATRQQEISCTATLRRGDDVREIIGLTERKMDSYLVAGSWVKYPVVKKELRSYGYLRSVFPIYCLLNGEQTRHLETSQMIGELVCVWTTCHCAVVQFLTAIACWYQWPKTDTSDANAARPHCITCRASKYLVGPCCFPDGWNCSVGRWDPASCSVLLYLSKHCPLLDFEGFGFCSLTLNQ